MISWDDQFSYSAIRKVRFDKKYSYTLYPNPATDFIQVNSDNVKGIHAEIRVINGMGQVLVSQKVDQLGGQVLLNVSGLSRGYYLLHIKDVDGSAVTERFTKQ